MILVYMLVLALVSGSLSLIIAKACSESDDSDEFAKDLIGFFGLIFLLDIFLIMAYLIYKIWMLI